MFTRKSIKIFLIVILAIIVFNCINIFLYSRTLVGFRMILSFYFLGSFFFLILNKAVRGFNKSNKFIKIFYFLLFGTFFTTIILSINYFCARNKTNFKTYKIDEISKISNPFLKKDQNLRIFHLRISHRQYKTIVLRTDKNVEILDKTKSLQLKLSEGSLGFEIIRNFSLILK
ncbi:hypothetical protein [Chryseobacterium sp. Hurlbut01]|uniref:hypothetical protein n=1 Tax=Chryseobacterium sp. Hurlbut01 TaxID=1681828 RepID=UPI000A77545E|nr:hypothetical protein [Chryseobacterium sp. Hurlbut01]